MDTKFSVALHVMIYIAETQNIPSSELLAKSVNTNSSHIRKIVAGLKKAKLIESSQGKAGFYLAKKKSEISLSEIYLSVCSEKKLVHLHENPNQECPIGLRIKALLSPVFDEVQQTFLEKLNKISLETLIKKLYEIGEK